MSTKWTFVHVASCSGSHMSYMSPSLIPHDIILADIRAVLDLDDLERDAAGVFELVLCRLGDEDRLALVEHGPLLAARDLGRAAQNDPVLRAMVVHLHRDGLAGEDADLLHPVADALADDRRRATYYMTFRSE